MPGGIYEEIKENLFDTDTNIYFEPFENFGSYQAHIDEKFGILKITELDAMPMNSSLIKNPDILVGTNRYYTNIEIVKISETNFEMNIFPIKPGIDNPPLNYPVLKLKLVWSRTGTQNTIIIKVESATIAPESSPVHNLGLEAFYDGLEDSGFINGFDVIIFEPHTNWPIP